MRKVIAFTLAEILIVISIIGLVAEATIPVLVQDTKEKITVVKLKKVHSVLAQAVLMASAENGPIPDWIDRSLVSSDGNKASVEAIIKIILPYLRVVKVCGFDEDGCFLSTSSYKTLNNKTAPLPNLTEHGYKFILADGSVINFGAGTSTLDEYCGTANWCGQFFVDVNGNNAPNQFGIDSFYITLRRDKVEPFAYKQDDFSFYCGRNITGSMNGLGCTAWVIENGNMDYLKCDGLSWEGKRSCSD